MLNFRKMFAPALACIALTLSGIVPVSAFAQAKPPVLIGLDGEFGHANSTSAEAIKQGILIAIEEINQHGGVLNGRPLQLVERANHAVPARSIANLKEFATMPDLVAVYCGRFSPTVLEAIPTIHQLKLPLLDPWAAADTIVDNGQNPNFAFRLSLKDSWAAPAMLRHLQSKKVKRVGLLMLNTSWGRGTKKAAEEYLTAKPGMSIVDAQWINWDDKEDSILTKYHSLRSKGAEGILLTANAEEAAVLGRAMLSLPPDQRLPVASHWGVAGGNLPALVGNGFYELDFTVVQTFTFIGASTPEARKVALAHNRLFGSRSERDIASQVGVAHAYDLTQLLAKALNKAKTTDREAVRDALESLGPYQGVVRQYKQPFTKQRHEALDASDIFMARYSRLDGALERSKLGR